MESQPAMAWRPFRSIGLKRALRDLKAIRGSYLSAPLAARLIAGWGASEAITPNFLRKCYSIAARTTGTILECGSGITTLVLAAGARRRPAGIVSLENDAYCRERVVSKLQALHLNNADVREAPLRAHGDFDWYAVDSRYLRRPIAAVICHGPPGSLYQREQLLQVLGHCLPTDCTILTLGENRTDA